MSVDGRVKALRLPAAEVFGGIPDLGGRLQKVAMKLPGVGLHTVGASLFTNIMLRSV